MAWWNPIDWAKSAGSEVLKEINAVKNWTINHVRDGINALARDLEDLINAAWHGLHSLEQDVVNRADNIWDHVGSVVATIGRDIRNAVNEATAFAANGLAIFNRDIVQPIEELAHDLVNEAIHLARVAVGDLRDAVVDFEHLAQRWVEDVRGALVDFEHTVSGWIDDAERFAVRAIDDTVSVFNRDVIQPIERGVAELVRDAIKVGDQVWSDTVAVVHAVEKAWDWIVLLGEHTLADIEHLPETVVHALSFDAVKSYVADTARGDLEIATKAVEEWLG